MVNKKEIKERKEKERKQNKKNAIRIKFARLRAD
jgi:hypothetical protein